MTLLDTGQAANFLAVPEPTLVRWRYEKRGPAFVRLGRAIRYREDDLAAFLAAHRVQPEGAQ